MILFKLPDLGEGLQDAEIREWHVRAGERIEADQPLVSVETAKAVVEVPSPVSGTVLRLHGGIGDTVAVGAALAEFEPLPGSAAPAEAASQSPSAAAASAAAAAPATDDGGARRGAITDTGTVVGAMQAGSEVVNDRATTVNRAAGLKVTPAVRALAHRLQVDLGVVTPSGPDGMILAADVQRVHRVLAESGPLEALHGPRRAMARTMAQARDEVMPTTVTDDAVLHAWPGGQDLTVRLIRALVAGVQAQPALNAWFDSAGLGRRLLDKIHLGVAVDTPDGLYVAVLQDVASRDAASLRAGLDAMKAAVHGRTVPPEELRGYTITLSNFGRFGGKYATPALVPPTVAIVAAGSVRDAVVPVDGAIRIAPVLPLSVTFDHRCVTGGEAAQFLAAMVADLQRAG